MKRGNAISVLKSVLTSLSSLAVLPFVGAQATPDYAALLAQQQAALAADPVLAAQVAQIQAQALSGAGVPTGISGLGLAGLAGAMIFIVVALGIAAYVYIAFALWAIAKKLKIENEWLAFIPVADFWIIKEAAQAPMWSFYVAIAGVVLAFIPGISVAGWVVLLGIFAWWAMSMCPRLGRPSWWAYILAIPFLSPVISAVTINATVSLILGLASIASAVLLGVLAWGNTRVAAGSMPVATAQLIKPSVPAPAPIVGTPTA